MSDEKSDDKSYLMLARKAAFASRLQEAIDKNGDNPNRFAGKLEMTASIVYAWLDPEVATMPKLSTMWQICEVYPEISQSWFFLGMGTRLGGQEAENIPIAKNLLAFSKLVDGAIESAISGHPEITSNYAQALIGSFAEVIKDVDSTVKTLSKLVNALEGSGELADRIEGITKPKGK